MYTSLLFLVVLFVPIPITIIGIKRKIAPYRVCMGSIIGTGVGLATVFAVAYMKGSSIGKEMTASVDEMLKTMPKVLVPTFNQVKDTAILSMPGTVIVLAAIFSYLAYLIISNLITVEKKEPMKLPPFKEFTVPRDGIMGWFVLFILSWVLKATGFSASEAVMININILFEFTFSLQGVSLVLLWCHLKKIPKIVPIAGIIFIYLTSIGQTFLFILGLGDILLGLRHRIGPKYK